MAAQPILRRLLGQLVRVGAEQRRRQDQQRIRTLARAAARNAASNSGQAADVHHLDLDAKRSGHRLDALELRRRAGRVAQHDDAARRGIVSFKQLHPFGAEIREIEIDAGDVAAGRASVAAMPLATGSVSRSNATIGIVLVAARAASTEMKRSGEHIDLGRDQLLRQWRVPRRNRLGIPRPRSRPDRHPSRLLQPFAERRQPAAAGRR